MPALIDVIKRVRYEKPIYLVASMENQYMIDLVSVNNQRSFYVTYTKNVTKHVRFMHTWSPQILAYKNKGSAFRFIRNNPSEMKLVVLEVGHTIFHFLDYKVLDPDNYEMYKKLQML